MKLYTSVTYFTWLWQPFKATIEVNNFPANIGSHIIRSEIYGVTRSQDATN